MNIDVNLGRRNVEEERHHGVPVARQHICIGTTHRARQQPVFDGAAVHEKILVVGDSTVECRKPGNTRQADSLALEIHTDAGVGERAVGECSDALRPGFARRNQQHPPSVMIKTEADIRPRHRQPPDCIETGSIFRAWRTQELASCGHLFEQAFDAHPRSGRNGGGPFLDELSVVDGPAPAIGASHPAFDCHARNARDGWQGLSAKAERGYCVNGLVRQFRRRVSFERKRHIVRGHAAAVIRHFDAVYPSARERNRDLPRPGVDRILDQFLQRCGWSFHHFTGRNAVDKVRGQATY